MCVDAPMETIENNAKHEFYNKLDEVYKSFSINFIKQVLGDLSAKCERETYYAPKIKKESLYAINNGNGLWLVFFAASNIIVARSTTFPHKNLYKGIYESPGMKIHSIRLITY